MANLRTGIYGNYYGSYFNESTGLTDAEKEVNARYIYSALKRSNWTVQSIAGILGNMEAESALNPGRWQGGLVGNISGGYGLVQWTPSTNYTNWCDLMGYTDPSEMDHNIERILHELDKGFQWIATSSYSFSFKEFTQSTLSPGELAKAFLLNYERPADQSISVQTYRAGLADKWYTFITGQEPIDPGSGGVVSGSNKKKYNFVLFGRKAWR